MTATTWDAALRAIEDDLDVQEERLRGGTLTMVPKWEEPTHLGPLPAEYAARVSELVKRIGLLSTFVQFQLVAADNDRKHAAAQAQRHAGGLNHTVAVFLDASA